MQSNDDDFFLGRYVLEKNLVSREALLECLYENAQERKSGSRAGFVRPLGVVLVARGLITEEELNRILASRDGAAGEGPVQTDAEVGRLLINAGLLRKEELKECLAAQEEMSRSGGAVSKLGEIVVKRGYATEQQLLRVLAYHKQLLFECKGCGVRVGTTAPPAGTRYRCKKCGGELTPAVRASEDPPSGRFSMREASHGEDVQLEIDRAMAAYLKQKGVVRRDVLRDCQRNQMEFLRYGLVVPLAEILRRAVTLTFEQQQALEATDFGLLIQDADWKKQAIPGYRLLKRVASGGFATIYTAEAVFQGGQVAVKVLHPERAKDRRAVSRLEKEADLLQRLKSPHIVRGIEYGSERGHHYLVMEHVEGRSLGQCLSEGGAFPLKRALSVGRQVAEALKYLHEQGFIHRDVKPDNAIIDEAGRVKLCDLGFAARTTGETEEEGKKGTVVGTRGYIAPEMARGAAVKVGSDIYALGILLYALLSGNEPFAGASSEEVVADLIEKGRPTPNLMTVLAPPPVIQLLKRMMHPDPSKRFASAAEVVEEIDWATEGTVPGDTPRWLR